MKPAYWTPALIAFTLAGCQSVSHEKPPETGGVAQITDADCGANKVKAYVGKDATDAVRAEVTAKSGAQSVRWITPETMVTMDLRHDRLNAHLGTDNKIGSLNCG